MYFFRRKPQYLILSVTFIVAGILFAANSFLLSVPKEPIVYAQASIPAFPGAEGFGAQSVGGRGGRVIEVINLNDSGPGSLRACVEASGPRTCVFRVGGTIDLQSRISVRSPYLTIAGQTAPGDGILIKHGGIRFQSGAHDIIIRYLRSAYGDSGGESGGSGQLYLFFERGTYNVVVDHFTGVWTLDEGISIYKDYNSGVEADWPDVYDITVQRSILAEGLAAHSTGMQVSGGGPDEAGWRGVYNISVHHNLFATNGQRNPLTKTKGVEVINNVNYNNRGEEGQSIEAGVSDWYRNYYSVGPGSGNRTGAIYIEQNKDIGYGSLSAVRGETSIFIEETYAVDYSIANPTDDNWPLVRDKRNGSAIAPVSWRRFSRLAQPSIPVTVQSASNAYTSIVTNRDVGANAKLDANGNFVSNEDPITNRIINYTRNNTGPSTLVAHQNNVGGYPIMTGGTSYIDSDKDGMADNWETLHFGTLARGSAANSSSDFDGDGYTDLEEFLNGTNPTTATIATAPAPAPTPTPTPGPTPAPAVVPSPTSGLIAHWKFDESSGITASDSTGNNNGTLTKMDSATDWVLGRIGNALDFDGADDYVNVPNNPTLDAGLENNAITVTAWVKYDAFYSDSQNDDAAIVEKDGNQFMLGLQGTNNNQPRFRLTTTTGTKTVGGSTLSPNTWYHFAGVYDGSILRLYQDGTQIASTPQTGTIIMSAADVHIGFRTAWNSNIDGIIDDVRIYNRALSATEVGELATASIILRRVGDLNGDGKVNILDVSILFSRWGKTDTTSLQEADISTGFNNTSSGRVDIFDANKLMANWTG